MMPTGRFIRLLPQVPRHAPKKRKNPQFAVVNDCGRWYITCEMVGHYNVKGEIWLR